ncbi:MAG: hypothetical protein QGH94_14450 [Phycisphaerae bacterium]|nr:hypothetical protein [Phycisphaerae bacterium]
MRKVLVVTVLVLTALVYQMLSSFGGGNNDIAITPELQATIAAAGAAAVHSCNAVKVQG